MKIQILSSERTEVLDNEVAKTPEYIEILNEIRAVHSKLLDILGKEEQELVDELESLNNSLCAVQSDYFYNLGFRDALIFLIQRQ
jgi:hypothetical protein